MVQFIDTVRAAGKDEYGVPGEIWLPELEVMFALACLRRARWDNHEKARLRRHAIIMGPTGASKSTCAEYFFGDFAGIQNFSTTPESHYGKVGMYLDIQSGMSWERIRGGISEKGLQIPMAKLVDFFVSSELLEFLGHTSSARRNKIDALNTFLESGRINVSLVKSSGVLLSDEHVKTMRDLDISYLPRADLLSYAAINPFVACTRFFTKEELFDIASSGLLSRFSVASWNPVPAEYVEWWNIFEEGEWRSDVSPHRTYIRSVNERMWRTQWLNVPFPTEYMQRGMRTLDKLYKEVEDERSLHPAVLRTRRDIGFVAQCITAAAVIRTTIENLNNPEFVVKRIEYTNADLEVAEELIAQRVMTLERLLDINDLEKLGLGGSFKKVLAEDAKKNVKRLRGFMLEPDMTLRNHREFPRAKFVDYLVNEGERVAESHAYRIVKQMTDSGIFTQPRNRVLRVSDKVWLEEFAEHDPEWQAEQEHLRDLAYANDKTHP